MGPAAAVLSLLLSGAPTGPEAPAPEAPAGSAVEVVPREDVRPGTRSWFALPVLFWLPETKLGMGGTGGLHFHLHGAKRASSIFLVGAYTLEHQGSADVAADVYFPRGAVIAARVRAVHFPDSFYGLGPSTSTSDRERFTRRFAEGIFDAEYPIQNAHFRAGPRLDVRGEEIGDVAAGGQLASGTVYGVNGFGAVGLGGAVTWDTRDRPLFPARGTFAQAWVLHYPSGVGGGHGTFTRGAIEGRIFLPLGEGRVLGAAAFLESASPETPFTLLPKLGSTRFLRGWREGRFRDRLAWAAQAELRLPLTERIHGAAFGAFGDVGPNLAALRAESLKVAGGLGARYRLTKEGANIRLDVAMSEAGPEVYVLVLEAF